MQNKQRERGLKQNIAIEDLLLARTYGSYHCESAAYMLCCVNYKVTTYYRLNGT